MKHSPTQLKQHILTQYRRNCRGKGFKELAQKYGIKGGGRAIKYWYDRWDGTAASLEQKGGAGRPTILSREEVKQYITTPIRQKNRKTEPVHYTDVLGPLQEKTGKQLSLRTIQRYGKENERINLKKTKKRTVHERKCTHKQHK
jgi:hypothetical protein